MNRSLNYLLAGVLAVSSIGASATTTPTYDTFGALPEATFGGTGISNASVAIDKFTGKNLFGQSTGTITLGLTATARYANNTLANDGHGTFTAAAGIDQTNAASILDQLATWNIDYYIAGATGSNLYTYKLLIDIDPSANDNFKTLYLSANSQNSTNVGSFPNELLGGYTFDPTKTGEYSIVLEALAFGTTSIVGKSSIVIDVKSPVPEPETYAMLLAGLGWLGVTARRRKA